MMLAACQPFLKLNTRRVRLPWSLFSFGRNSSASGALSTPKRCNESADTIQTLSIQRSTYNDGYSCRSYKIAAFEHIHQSCRRASLFRREKEYEKPWHDPSFMEVCSPETVEQWLVSLLKVNKEKVDKGVPINSDSKVDSIAYLRVLEAYAKSNIGGAPQKAEYWIGQLERHYDQVAKSYLLKTTPYASNEVEGDELSDDDPDSSSTNEMYTAGNDGSTSPFGKFIASKSLHNNEDLSNSLPFKQVFTTHENTPPKHIIAQDKDAEAVRDLRPTVECYNAVIEAWSNDNDKVSVVRARRWLSKLEGLGLNSPIPTGHPLYYKLEPNATSYDLYLRSCSRGIGRKPKLHRQRAEEAEAMLRYRMSDKAPLTIRPTTESYNYCIRAWTRCRKELHVADKVMSLVREMEAIQRDCVLGVKNQTLSKEDSWKEHITPDTKTYTMAIDAWIIVATLKANRWHSEQLDLNNAYKTMAYKRKNNALEDRDKFLARRNKFENGDEEMEKAAAILKYIKSLEAAGRADIHATVIGYNTLLGGWARLSNTMRSEIPLKSETILRDMMESFEDGIQNAAPDVMSFNAVIKAWANTKRPNSASRSEWWLRRMIRESKNAAGDEENTASVPEPNAHTYNLVMEAYLQLGDPSRVQDLILEMDASDSVLPNSESFSKVIRAWLHDEMNDQQQHGLPGLSCENAYKWLKELLDREKSGDYPDLGSAPDLFASILKTAAKTRSRGENILTVGQGTFWVRNATVFFL